MAIYKQKFPQVDKNGIKVKGPDGKWVMLESENWTIDFTVNGKRKREVIGPNKQAAKDALAAATTKVKEGRYFDIKKDCKETFGALADLYEADVKEGKSYRATKFYFPVVRSFFADKLVGEIKRSDVLAFRKRMEDTPTKHGQKRGSADVNRHMALLRAILKKAVEMEWIVAHPGARIPKLKENGRVRKLTLEEAKLLLASCNDRLRSIVFTALETAMRKEEVVGLRWSEISGGMIRLPAERTKDNEARNIPVTPALAKELLRLKTARKVIGKAPADFVFQGAGGEPVKSIEEGWKRARQAAGIEDFHFHDLRHTAASWLLEAGAPMKLVGDILGHSSMYMTDKYVHTSDDAKAEAMARMPSLGAQAS